jgi:hypothetical protein
MNGLDELAVEILEAAGLTEADVDDVPTFGVSTLKPPPVVTSTTNINLGHQSPRAKTSLTRPLQMGTLRVVTMSPTSMVSIPQLQLPLLLWMRGRRRKKCKMKLMPTRADGNSMQMERVLKRKSWMKLTFQLRKRIWVLVLHLVWARLNFGFATRLSQPITLPLGHSIALCR